MFEEDPAGNLIIECDQEVRRIRERVEQESIETKINYILPLALIHNNKITDNMIIKVVRIIDVKNAELQYTKSQLGSNVEYVDINARNTFGEGASTSKLKCISGFNHHGR